MKKISCAVLVLLLVVVCSGCGLAQAIKSVDKDAVKDVIYSVQNPIDIDAEIASDYDEASFDVTVANRYGGEDTYSLDADFTPVKQALAQIPTEGKYDIRVRLGKVLDQTYEIDFSNWSVVRIK